MSSWLGGVGVTPYVAAQVIAFDLPSYAETVNGGASTFALNYAGKTVTIDPQRTRPAHRQVLRRRRCDPHAAWPRGMGA